jgi:spore maturation protein B
MDIMKGISRFAVPAIFLMILGFGAWKDVKVYDEFVEGAREGMATVVRILPSLVGLLVAVGVFRASGALDLLVYATRPIAGLIGIPSEAMPLAFMRPISGSASIALVNDIIGQYGSDSFIGRLVSTMMGSTETIFYTLAVYFGSVGIKNIRYTLVAALTADLAGVIASVWICTVVFGR